MAFGDRWEEYFSNKSFASELARSREASKHIDENLIFCPDGGFQVWTIEGSSSDDGECGGGGIELKLTSCGRGLHMVDELKSRRSTYSNKRNLTCCLFVMVCIFVGFFLSRLFHL